MMMKHVSVLTVLFMVLAGFAFGQDDPPVENAAKVPDKTLDVAHSIIPLLLGEGDEVAFAGDIVGLSKEEKELLVDESTTIEKECAKIISHGKAVLSNNDLAVKDKIAKLNGMKLDGPPGKALKAACEKLEKTLAPGKIEMLGLWSSERLAMLAGENVSAAQSGQAVSEAIAKAVGAPEGYANKIKQSWIYYKTIELTHRKRIVQGKDSGGEHQAGMIRMTRSRTDSISRQFLPEDKRSAYNKYMGLE